MQVTFAQQGTTGVVVLNRPEAMNALNLDMVRAIAQRLEVWADDPSIERVLFKGAGEKAFCAGGDIRFMHSVQPDQPETLAAFFREEYAMNAQIHRFPKPTIALMDGVIMGGGMGIAQGCTLRIATEKTRMAMPETLIGMFPDVGGSYFLSRLPHHAGMYLGLVGTTVNGLDATLMGLADLYLSSADMPFWQDRLDAWMSVPCVNSTLPPLLPSVLGPGVLGAVDRCFGQPTVADMLDALKDTAHRNDDPAQGWARTTLDRLGKMSPLMVHVTHALLVRGAALELEDCLAMEARAMHHAFHGGDAMEGIRALAVDKDHTPRWQHPDLASVPQERVLAFFQ